MPTYPQAKPAYAIFAAILAATLVLTACGQHTTQDLTPAAGSDDTTSSTSPPSTTAAPTTSSDTVPPPAPEPPATTSRTPRQTDSTTKKTTVNSPPSETRPSPPGALRLPSHESEAVPAGPGSDEDRFVTGDGAAGCIWIKDSAGERYAALWPHGYYAMFKPARIFNEQGTEVWREGQGRNIGGGRGSTMYVDRIPKQCRTGDHALWIGSLTP